MRKAKGFSLIEVMVALAIMAVAVTTLLVIRNNAVIDAGIAVKVRRKNMLLEQKMADIKNGTTLDTHLDSEGEIYTTLFVTVFGTCILYFLFRRLYQT